MTVSKLNVERPQTWKHTSEIMDAVLLTTAAFFVRRGPLLLPTAINLAQNWTKNCLLFVLSETSFELCLEQQSCQAYSGTALLLGVEELGIAGSRNTQHCRRNPFVPSQIGACWSSREDMEKLQSPIFPLGSVLLIFLSAAQNTQQRQAV